MKVQVTIDIPDGWELAEPEMRPVKQGESYLHGRLVMPWDLIEPSSWPHPILRRSWTWPAWLKARWIAMDKNGLWWATQSRPILTIEMDSWWEGGPAITLRTGWFDFTPPPCTDWTQSLRENPNWREA